MTVKSPKQRSDYTFKYNRDFGRHGWLRLTPAYSVKLVDEILRDFPCGLVVLDPFSGTGTTPLCAAYHGHSAVGYELNPFLVWLGSVKVRRYSAKIINDARESLAAVLEQVSSGTSVEVDPPRIHNIERWWSSERLDFLCQLMGCIQEYCPCASAEKDLLLVAFCRVMIDLSNAAFNHQSMSFREKESDTHPQLFVLEPDYPVTFAAEASRVIDSALSSPPGSAEIVMGDSRNLAELKGQQFDLLITSPPYPNRMSYIRELRPYMYWLGYLEEAREAGELDWQAIGGTWGIATSRLNQWEPTQDAFRPAYFDGILRTIAISDGKNGRILSRYVAKYFEDIWLHLCKVQEVMREDGRLHYIIGNSVFYGTIVPVEVIYKDMLQELGFHNVEVRRMRKRNSKKTLFEFDVSARR